MPFLSFVVLSLVNSFTSSAYFSLRLGHSLDKGIDMGPIVDESQRRTIEEYVEGARAEGADVFQVQLDQVPGKRSVGSILQ